MKDKDASYQARSITIRLGLAAAVLLSVLLLSPPVRLFERGEGLWLGLHLMLEVSAVVVAALVVAVSWYSLERAQRRQSNALIFGFTVTAICDLLHALSYAGMPALLSESSTSKAIYFWLAARIFETLALALLAVNLRLPGAAWRWFVGAIGVALGIFWVLTWHPGHLPAVYVPEYGLTTFKVFVEYALCLANLAIAVTFWGAGQRTGRSRGFWLAGACFVMALGEVAFASYHAPEDSLNVLGHVFKVLADWLIFRAVFAINIRQPYDLVRRAEASLRDREVQLAALARNIPNGLLFQLERDQQGHHLTLPGPGVVTGPSRLLLRPIGALGGHEAQLGAEMRDTGRVFKHQALLLISHPGLERHVVDHGAQHGLMAALSLLIALLAGDVQHQSVPHQTPILQQPGGRTDPQPAQLALLARHAHHHIQHGHRAR